MQGKSNLVDLRNDQLLELKEFFNTLDVDRSGTIGADELYGPLIGLGLVQSTGDVDDLFDLVDGDGSG